MKVAILGNKGGVGKTMIAAHLAWGLAEHYPTLLFDTDYAQGSAFRWVTGREFPHPDTIYRIPDWPGLRVMVVSRENVKNIKHIIAQREEDFFVIDGRPEPYVSAQIAESLDYEDIAILPIDSASVDSIRQVKELWRTIQEAKADRAKYYVVVNKLNPNSEVSQRWITAIENLGLRYLLAIPASEMFPISEKTHVPMWELRLGTRLGAFAKIEQLINYVLSHYNARSVPELRGLRRFYAQPTTSEGVSGRNS